jgi:hypothetical protein
MKFVFKLVKFILGLLTVCLLAYVAFFVSFGNKTLYQHLVGISKTKEAKVLGREVEKKVEHTAEDISHTIKEKVPKMVESVYRQEEKDTLGKEPAKEDKQALKKLIRAKEQPSAQDKKALQELIQKKNR